MVLFAQEREVAPGSRRVALPGRMDGRAGGNYDKTKGIPDKNEGGEDDRERGMPEPVWYGNCFAAN